MQREYDSAMERQARLTEAAIDVEDARLARTEELLMLQEQCDEQLRGPQEVSSTGAFGLRRRLVWKRPRAEGLGHRRRRGRTR